MAVMLTLTIGGILALSVASLINFQRKMGIRQQLKLHSMNAAEAAIDYAYAFVTNDANDKGLDNCTYIPQYGGSPKPFPFSAAALSFLKNKNGLPATSSGNDPIEFTDIKVTVMPRPQSQVRVYKDPKTTDDSDPNRGEWVYEETITMVSAVTSIQGGITQVSYACKDININIKNLFQHAVFFQGQLHMHRGFKVMGSVHTNGNLILNAQNNDHAIYNGFVAAGNRFYRGSIIDSGGSGANGFALAPEKTNGDLDLDKIVIKPTGNGSGTQTTTPTTTPPSTGGLSGGDIPIYTDTPTANNFLYRFVDKTTDSQMTNWKDTATNLFLGYLQDKSHKVPIITPIGTKNYSMATDGTANNSPYFLIEPLLPPSNALRQSTSTAPTQKTNYRYNLSANASLVLRVEYIARDSLGTLIDYDPTIYDDSTSALAAKTGYCPTSAYASKWVDSTKLTPLPQSKNPANYIVRAYAKPANKARANDPTDYTNDRVRIPFPTDVIGRADYTRAENTGSYAYTAGVAPQPIDVLGTETNITTASAATTWSPARVRTADLESSTANRKARVLNEAWHRYHIECYYPVTSVASAAAYSTTYSSVLPGIGNPNSPRTTPTAISATATSGSNNSFPLYGLHDSRLGRGVHLLTLDISRLKQIMEEPIANVAAKYGAEASAFRQAFNNGTAQWNGIIYVEFPTTTTVLWDTGGETSARLNHAPSTSVFVNNPKHPEISDETLITPATDRVTGHSYLDTYLFDYASTEETRYPLRTSDTTTITRKDKTVPIAAAFRTYPGTVDTQTICDPANATMGLQVINAEQLPSVTINKFDANAANTLTSGFTLATNAPLYLIGSWNSDGDYTTGTNVTSTDPTKYATTDTLTSTSANNPEIPSAIFCDMFTVLSPGWASQTGYLNEPSSVSTLTRRQNSFPGWNNGDETKSDSYKYRTVEWLNTNERIEISACIATGDFPIFEFFTHALEDFKPTNGTPCTPLVVKGAMVSMFTSEVQHIKQAYGRDPAKDIQVYWNGHGANCFPSPRLHQFIIDGNFPPGTPQALVPSQSNFQIIFKTDPLVSAAGL